MDRFKQILGIIRVLLQSASVAGVPVTGLIAALIGIAQNIADQEAQLTGKTRAQIFAKNKIDFAQLEADLDEDAAKGE